MVCNVREYSGTPQIDAHSYIFTIQVTGFLCSHSSVVRAITSVTVSVWGDIGQYKTPLRVTCKRNYVPKNLEAAVHSCQGRKVFLSRGNELPDSDSNQEESNNCWFDSFEERLKHARYDTASSGSRLQRRGINVSPGKSVLGRDMTERETEGQEESEISVLEQEQEEEGPEEQPQEVY
ncbi:hypothetical protein ANN_10006 [Periplaneta americana]|uniref:Uncharacterized protein n=1 Tax=Periplaneta americana TaxID=6978 RepID=A0ABQ8TPD7_PERAM|nr:hypothetical protein ANN_10006 [Periplaneta americana]